MVSYYGRWSSSTSPPRFWQVICTEVPFRRVQTAARLWQQGATPPQWGKVAGRYPHTAGNSATGSRGAYAPVTAGGGWPRPALRVPPAEARELLARFEHAVDDGFVPSPQDLPDGPSGSQR
jgi:hypothetical protein